MVEAISHSKIWAQSAIFIEEDDSQGGVAHVDGDRQPVFVIRPYTAAPQTPGQSKAIHTTYTAENINRTIENILGMQPLTQFDPVGSPMFDAFQNTPGLTPYDHLSPSVPLDKGPGLGSDTTLGYNATAEVMKGKYDTADAVDPNFLNHITWYASTAWIRPYPGENKVEMPATFIKAARKYR